MSWVNQDSSKYKHSILFQRKYAVQEVNGSWSESWKSLYHCKAEVNNLSGNEFWTALGNKQQNIVIFGLRNNIKLSELSDKDRILFNDNIYEIMFPDDIFYAGSKLKIKAKKIVTQHRKNVIFNVPSGEQITVRYPLRKWNLSIVNNQASLLLLPGEYEYTIGLIENEFIVKENDSEVIINVE